MAYADYSPPGPWYDGQVVTRITDGTVFIYSVSLNALYIYSNVGGAVKYMNGYTLVMGSSSSTGAIINATDPHPTLAQPHDVVTVHYFNNHTAGSEIPATLAGSVSVSDPEPAVVE